MLKRKVIITGSSSGIGKALTKIFLSESAVVDGIARRKTIEHKNYRHIYLDLEDSLEVSNFEFSNNDDFDEVVLVNNAGWIGEVKPVGKISSSNIIKLNQINISAPFVLMNKFLAQYANANARLKIVNISSGAAKNVIKSWAGYCASKAALEMFTRVISEEHIGVECMAISPGVVNTEMQRDIREVEPKDFEASMNFHELYRQGELKSPEETAKVIANLIVGKEKAPGVIFSLRDL